MTISEVISTKEQIVKIESMAYKIWKRYTPFEVQEQLLSTWDDLANFTDIKGGFEPLYSLSSPDEKITCGILGSGGFSTGRLELEKAARLNKRLGWSPVEYCAVITNRERSNALEVAKEFNLPCLVLDYTEWRKRNNVNGSTKLFGFASGEEPSHEVLADRIKIKKAFDLELNNVITEQLGNVPRSISLRGYDFILTDQLFSPETEVDNTHPATLIIREPNGEPAYAGWQDAAYNKMREDGFTKFQTSLIRVGYIGNVPDLTAVDAGELLAISPGNPDEYDKVEDHYLLTLKSTGLLPYFWGLSKKRMDVEYQTKNGEIIKINQKLVIVNNKIFSGRNAFGQTVNDLEILNRFLTI